MASDNLNVELPSAIPKKGSDSSLGSGSDRESASRQNGLIGKCFDGYTVVGHLGRGSFGEVYRVEGKDTGASYAMKHMRCTTDTTFKILKKLSAFELHPYIDNVVAVLDKVDCHRHRKGDYVWFVMEYCDGGNLNDYILENPGLDLKIKMKFMSDIANGMQFIHAKGIVHRNLKPDNVMLQRIEGDSIPRCRVADYGLAQVWEANTTLPKYYTDEVHTNFGPPYYTAPEVANDIITQKADIYVLGILFLGILLETTENCLWMNNHTLLVPKINDRLVHDMPADELQNALVTMEIPEALRDIIVKMVAADHKKRPSIYDVFAVLQCELFKMTKYSK